MLSSVNIMRSFSLSIEYSFACAVTSYGLCF